jgi:hypothetical protein
MDNSFLWRKAFGFYLPSREDNAFPVVVTSHFMCCKRKKSAYRCSPGRTALVDAKQTLNIKQTLYKVCYTGLGEKVKTERETTNLCFYLQ